MAVYDLITNRIIGMLDKGIIPWKRPWNVPMPQNFVSKREYQGVNVLLLSFTGFNSPYWLTYKQARDLGGHVKAGAKGLPVVFWNWIKVKGKGSEEDKSVPFLKYHTVFNLEQCEGIAVPDNNRAEIRPLEECEKVFEGMPDKPALLHGGDKACYIPSKDTVLMPNKGNFESTEEYYSTLFHELAHATGHDKRLNRVSLIEPHAFGSETYSKEELIAEIGSSFLCSLTGIENKTIDNQVGYISSWLNRLKNDKKLIITASSHAQKAVDFILNQQ